MVTLLLQLAIILAAAKVGAEISERFKQPAVLGELLVGILLGNLVLMIPSLTFFDAIRIGAPGGADGIDTFAAVGVVLILFEAGLDTSLADMRRVGLSSTLVAVVGVVAPFALGYGVSALLIHEVPAPLLARAPGFPLAVVHLFIGATLTATSVGITARVFKDLGVTQRVEARIVLGAAVIDDVIGLMILAIVNGIVMSASLGTTMEWSAIALLCLSAVAFLAGALVLGVFIVPRVIMVLSRFRARGVMVAGSLALCMAFSAAAGAVGLAPIVGAFAAGLILEDSHFSRFTEGKSLRELIAPIVAFIGPVFFVVIGMRVHLESLSSPNALLLGGLLLIAAILGKVICGLVVGERVENRWIVAWGMVPRGEVGLIFAGIGASAGVIDQEKFSALVFVMVLTTLLTPILLASAIKPVRRT